MVSTIPICWSTYKNIKTKKPGKPTKMISSRQCFSAHVLCLNGCCAWLCLCTGWSFFVFSWFGPVCSPTWKDTLLETSIPMMMVAYLLLMTFLKPTAWKLLPQYGPRSAGTWRNIHPAGCTGTQQQQKNDSPDTSKSDKVLFVPSSRCSNTSSVRLGCTYGYMWITREIMLKHKTHHIPWKSRG